jgi:hypothetical protein
MSESEESPMIPLSNGVSVRFFWGMKCHQKLTYSFLWCRLLLVLL